MSKVSNEVIKKQQEEAEKRAAALGAVVNKVIELMVENDLSVNDFQVVTNECQSRLANVFISKKVKDFYIKE